MPVLPARRSRLPFALAASLLLCLAALLPGPASVRSARAGVLDDRLVEELNRTPPGNTLRAVAFLSEQVDVRLLEERMRALGIVTPARRHEFVLRAAMDLAERTQPPVRAQLESLRARGDVVEYRSFWISNCIVLEARPSAFTALALRGDLGPILSAVTPELRRSEDAQPPRPLEKDGVRDLELALQAINVQAVWDSGYTGTGRLVCDFDTGADGTHPALQANWRGSRPGVPWYEAWKDPYTGTEFPYDHASHGTATLGTMVANPLGHIPMAGVAYNARWIAAGALIGWDVGKILDCYQWAIDPDGNPATLGDVPDVINNSWGTPQDCDSTFWGAIDLVEAAGIVNTISVDNSGPDSMSVNSPESRAASPTVNFGIGAIDQWTEGYPLYYGSGRGPSPCDSVALKPQVTAPGVAVRSTFPGGGYTWKTGTSMACPHVSGAAALLRQMNPALTVEQVKTALMVTASDFGPSGPDNGYGYGVLNVAAAMDWVFQNHPPLPPPRNLAGDMADSVSVGLTWSAPVASAQGDSLIGYRVYRALGTELYTTACLDSVAPPDTSYIDVGPAPGNYRYEVTAVYASGAESAPSNEVLVRVLDPAASVSGGRPREALTVSMRPNPSRSTIEFSVPVPGPARVSLDVFEASGRRVYTAETEGKDGEARFLWDGRDARGERLGSGAYFALVRAGERKTIGRLVLLP